MTILEPDPQPRKDPDAMLRVAGIAVTLEGMAARSASADGGRRTLDA